MAERVEILVVATDAASQVMRGVTSSFGQLGSMVQGITSGRGLEILTEQVIQFGKQSVEATLKYANEVRNLSLISGESTEETSRFLQVLDDYKLSAEDAMTATRAMTKEGLVPNIDTLAKLSDQYLSITDKQEQNEFVIKNLGRAGLQWVDVLNKGSVAIRAQGDAIDEGLLLTQKAVDDARRYEIALDNWNDSVQTLKVSIGNQLIPAITDLINGMNEGQRAAEIMTEKGFNPANKASKEYRDALLQAKAETRSASEAMVANAEAADIMTEAHEKTKEEMEAEEKAAKALTDRLSGYLELASNMFDEQKDYTKTIADLNKDRAKIEKEMAEASVKGSDKATHAAEKYREKLEEINGKIDEANEKGKDTEDLIERRTQLESDYAYAASQGQDDVNGKAQDYIDKLADIDAKIQETKEKHHEAMGQMQYDLIYTKLAADGLTSAEFDIAVQAGLTFGVFDQKSADAAVAMNHLTDMVSTGKMSVYEYGEILKRSMRDGQVDAAELQRIIAEIPGYKTSTIDVVTNYYSNNYSSYSEPDIFGIQRETQGNNAGLSRLGGGRAGGGEVNAGMLYRVNETREEYFQPSGSGAIIPLGGGNGSSGQGMTFVYSPGISLGSQSEARDIIAPFVEQAVRKMQSDGRVGQ